MFHVKQVRGALGFGLVQRAAVGIETETDKSWQLVHCRARARQENPRTLVDLDKDPRLEAPMIRSRPRIQSVFGFDHPKAGRWAVALRPPICQLGAPAESGSPRKDSDSERRGHPVPADRFT